MRLGRTYEVFVDGNPVGLVGSTLLTLNERRRNGYVKRFGQGVELCLIREVPRHESEDDVSYNFHLKAAEALDIARKETYWETGGLNKISPLIQAIGSPMLEAERGRIGGRIGGRKNVENGHIQALGRKAVESGRLASIRTPENQSKGGRISGPLRGRKNVESGQLASIRSAGGRVSGRKNVENGHIQALGRVQGRKAAGNGHLARIAALGGHALWHVKRGVVNSACSFCAKDRL